MLYSDMHYQFLSLVLPYSTLKCPYACVTRVSAGMHKCACDLHALPLSYKVQAVTIFYLIPNTSL